MRGAAREVHLEGGGDEHMLRQRFHGQGIRQHIAHHQVAGGGIGLDEAIQRGGGGLGHGEAFGGGEEPVEGGLERQIGGETAAIQRRHGELLRPFQGRRVHRLTAGRSAWMSRWMAQRPERNVR